VAVALPRFTRILAAIGIAAVAGAGVQTLAVLQPADAATLTGIDVSRWDHPNGAAINWPKVKSAGRSFAIIKATEGTTYVNPYFASDIAQARSAGLVVGAYHFAQPRLPISSAAADARHYVRTVGSFRSSNLLPPILDLECSGTGTCTYGRTLSVNEMRQWTQLWLDTAESMTGRTPILYTYDSFWRNALGNSTAFTRYPFWYARYTTVTPTASMLPGGWSRWTFWQYTSTQSTPGLPRTGAVGDVNRFNGSLDSLKALANGSRAIGLSAASRNPIVSASGDRWAKLNWSAPSDSRGAPVLDYTVQIDGKAPVVTPNRTFVATGLTAGDHSVVIRARTVAGSGEAAVMTLPIDDEGAAPPASRTNIALGVTTKLPAGSSTSATVRLTRSDTGQAVAGATVVWARTPKRGSAPAPITLTTRGDGSAFVTLKYGVNTTNRVSFAGSYGQPAARATKTTSVVAWLSAKMVPTTVRRGQVAVLQVSTSYLFAGATVQRQDLVRGRWRTTSSRVINKDGKASFGMAYTTPGTKTFRLILKSTDAHWGTTSAPVRLTVR
jgi:GH25 family lysozyme M1 (1,4-beta-N-acetylmuramidase)